MKRTLNTDFSNIQVGDTVAVDDSRYGEIDIILCTVKRVTKTQIEVDFGSHQRKFNRKDGRLVGGSTFHSLTAFIPTEEQIAEIKEEELRRRLLYNISKKVSDRSLMRQKPTETLKALYKLLTE